MLDQFRACHAGPEAPFRAAGRDARLAARGPQVWSAQRLRAERGATRRAPLQSLPALMMVVWASPAVGADSVMSLGSTCPSRPALGVSSQITPLSASGPRASTR